MEPEIIAEVTFLPTNLGGRRGPTPPDHFGCPLQIAKHLFDCRLLLAGIGAVSPGQTVTVPIKFLQPELVAPHLHEGAEFELWERGTIAKGHVVALMPAV